MTWKGTLQPGEKQHFRLRYAVKRNDLGDRRLMTRVDGHDGVVVKVRGTD